MQLYYLPTLQQGQLQLPNALHKHIAIVLRKNIDETFLLTNGKGTFGTATIIAVSKKSTVVEINNLEQAVAPPKNISLAIAFTKNVARIEWMLEKIVEIGVSNIYPIVTERTEKFFPKMERWRGIVESAMCQSKRYFLPTLLEPTSIQQVLSTHTASQKFIAHCHVGIESKLLLQAVAGSNDSLIFIGPEGDFTSNEVSLCLAQQCLPVSLGSAILRTETAGLVAVTLLNHG